MDFENTIKGTTAEEYKEAYLDIVHYMANGCYNGENSLPVKTLETSMVALFNANKYGWHDLISNKYDLPQEEKEYLIKGEFTDRHGIKIEYLVSKFFGYGEICQGFKEFPEGCWEAHTCGINVLAWKEIEPFEE